MKNMMCITDTEAVLVGYKKQGNLQSVQWVLTQEIEQGAIIGGTIIKPESIAESLESLCKRLNKNIKNVTLVIDCQSIIVKKIKAPILKHAQYITHIRTEIQSSAGEKQDMVYGYTKLEDRAVLGYGIPIELIEGYKEVFDSAGISISEIISGAESLVEFVKTGDQFKSEVANITIVQGVSRLSMVFNKGEYLLSSRGRVYSEKLEDDLAQETVRTSQFCNAQPQLGNLKKSYYCGIGAQEIENISGLLSSSKIDVIDLMTTLKLKEKYQRYTSAAIVFIAIANSAKPTPLLKTLRDNDKLLQQQKNIAEGKNHMGGKLAGVALLIMVAFIGYLAYSVVDASGKIATLNKQIADIEEKAKQSNGYEMESNGSIEVIGNIRRYKEGTKELEILDTGLVKAVAAAFGEDSTIQELRYASDSGEAEFLMESPSKYAAAQGTARVRELPGVLWVGYTGFERDVGEKGFTYTVKVGIKQPKPAPVPNDPAQEGDQAASQTQGENGEIIAETGADNDVK
ncbi:MAG: hypothetical protein RR846_08410 [Oscillospiraceae bacterium]